MASAGRALDDGVPGMKLRQSGAGHSMNAPRASEDYFLSMQMQGIFTADNS
jgi:hypothetical protein